MIARNFLTDRRGSIAPIFGLAALIVFGSVGAAIDYSRAGAARAELQAVLDAVALMLSKEAIGLSKQQLREKTDAYVQSMFKRAETRKLKIVPEFVTDGNTFRVTLKGSAKVDTAFSNLLGVKTLEIGTSAQVAWEMRRLELALALDNTGSMSSLNKMNQLKKATKELLKTLKASARTPDHIKVAIVPFDTVVNIGTADKDASWLRFDGGVDKASWNGCITDRDMPYDAQDAAPTSHATNFLAAKCKSSGALEQIRPLTNDWTALEQTVEAMTPSGMTNVTIGFAWGWHALTPDTPLTGASAPRADLDKILVVLTDGNNTQNRSTQVAAEIDARTQQVCANVKGTGIKVYTIRVIEGNAAMLKACASAPDMYYDVKDASQLSGVFKEIAKSLANIRIAK